MFLNRRMTMKALGDQAAANLELQRTNAVLETRVLDLERQLATERARFEWLTVHVNEMKTERAILFDRVLEVQIPVMQVSREAGPVKFTPRLTPEGIRDEVAYVRPPEGATGRVFRPGDDPVSAQMAEAMAAGDLFNDVGDERARTMGLGWDGEGNLAVDVPPAVAAAR